MWFWVLSVYQRQFLIKTKFSNSRKVYRLEQTKSYCKTFLEAHVLQFLSILSFDLLFFQRKINDRIGLELNKFLILFSQKIIQCVPDCILSLKCFPVNLRKIRLFFYYRYFTQQKNTLDTN